jgi:hypothetical protein
MVIYKRLVMHSRVPMQTGDKGKNPKGGVVCTGACLYLGTMLDFLCFMNVDPQKLRLGLSFSTLYPKHKMECNARRKE